MTDFVQTQNKLSYKKKKRINNSRQKIILGKNSSRKTIISSLNSSEKTLTVLLSRVIKWNLKVKKLK